MIQTMIRSALALSLLSVVACNSKGQAPPESAEEPGASGRVVAGGRAAGVEQNYDHLSKDPEEARRGCRAPDEEGCASCCNEEQGSFSISSWSGGGSSDVKPWYNVNSRADSCEGHPACAQCTERNERELKELKKPEGCDCSTQEIGVDPCMAPSSCACYCSRASYLEAACPE